ncbi:penicillin acylase family protein [Yinghuangia soli]|uniref:Penicillin acylase family protein n=1 Tax=Yinghuangia soli TaxID=2908204 RepID=A0AA41Q010_9ACTN|nr:penicillin acylase family protein [Yinghuangia soli]MCF2528261.1 penicillin acylase family protein [Yinghuangia soli]
MPASNTPGPEQPESSVPELPDVPGSAPAREPAPGSGAAPAAPASASGPTAPASAAPASAEAAQAAQAAAPAEGAEPAAALPPGVRHVEERPAKSAAPRPKRKIRRLRNAAIAFVLLLAVVLGALGWYGYDLSRRSFPELDGAIKVPGLSGRVEVLRDKNGIPQIYADTPEDLFRAQGYVQAQDRFWEMDVRRHMTSGRLSEMFGADQVDNDIFLRTLGWRRIAEQEVAKLTPQSRAYVEAYAAGVNSYIKGRDVEDMSFEYALLGFVRDDYKPGPWDAADSVAWLKAMAWDLRANLQDEIDRALLSEKLTVNQIDELYPPYPYERNQPIVPSGAIVKDQKDPSIERFQPDAAAPVPSKSAAKALTELSQALESLPPIFTDRSAGVGSNSWVVSGSRTTTGKPLMANDPHLSASLPSVWYQMGLHCRTVSAECPYDVSGFTFSGMPGVVIGHNQKISWGLTNLGADVADLYLEKTTGEGYLYDGAPKEFDEVRQEVIKVAGGKDRVITVRSTRHGPILSEASDELEQVGKDAPIPDPGPQREDGFAVALRWTALEAGTTMESLFQLNRATDWNTFRDALRGFDVPSQNVVYADVEGNIGYQAPGRIPIRRFGDGRWPAYGWDPKYEWDSMIPFDSLPYRYNPPEGYIVTANNAVTPPTYPYSLTTDWGYGSRSQRIIDMIEAQPKIDPQAMSRMQMDNRNPIAETLVPYLLAVQVKDPWVREAQNLLKGWDFTQPADSKAAAYFNGVWRQLLLLAFGDKMPLSVRAESDCDLDKASGDTECGDRDDSTALPDGGDRWFEVVRNLLPDAESPWWNISDDPAKITTRDALLLKAMTSARKELTTKMSKDIDNWSWGKLHTLELRNQTLGTEGPGVVKWMLNRGEYQLGGGEGLVDATGWNAAQGYEVTTVPSMRMVVDMSDLDASRWINLTGASGHVWHDNYTDQTDLWRKGRTLVWAFTRPAVEAAAEHTLILEPEGLPGAPGGAPAPGTTPPGNAPGTPGAQPGSTPPSGAPTGRTTATGSPR